MLCFMSQIIERLHKSFSSLNCSVQISTLNQKFLEIPQPYSEAATFQEVFYKIAILKNFVIFTGKLLCWGLFFINVAGLQACNCIKKGLQHRYFLVNIRKFVRTSILQNQKQPPEVFCQKRCSSKFRKTHRKHLCQGLFLNKVADLGLQLY